MAVADALSAMTEARPYRASLSPDQAVEEVTRAAGVMFDPCVVRDLLSLRGAVTSLLAQAAQEPARPAPGAGPALCPLLCPA